MAKGPSDPTTLDGKQRDVPSPIAAAAERQLHTLLPLIQRLHLLVELYDFVLPTGDNVSTVAPHFLRWMADPALDVTDVGRRHLAQALAHEAFHAARFAGLPDLPTLCRWPAHLAAGSTPGRLWVKVRLCPRRSRPRVNATSYGR